MLQFRNCSVHGSSPTHVTNQLLATTLRYMDRTEGAPPPPPPDGGLLPPTAALSSPSFPVRHWFEDSDSLIANAQQQIPALGAAAVANGVGVRAPLVGTRERSFHDPPEAPVQSNYLAAWRGMSGPPILAPNDSGCEDEEPRPILGGGEQRPQTRSSSRDGRPRSSTEARRFGGNSGGAWDVNGGRSNQVPLSPVLSGTINSIYDGNGENSNTISSESSSAVNIQRVDSRRTQTESSVAMTPNDIYYRVNDEVPFFERQEIVGRRPGIESGSLDNAVRGGGESRPMARGGQPRRGRRSLSDFLREIEEVVRAQRAEVGGCLIKVHVRGRSSSTLLLWDTFARYSLGKC